MSEVTKEEIESYRLLIASAPQPQLGAFNWPMVLDRMLNEIERLRNTNWPQALADMHDVALAERARADEAAAEAVKLFNIITAERAERDAAREMLRTVARWIRNSVDPAEVGVNVKSDMLAKIAAAAAGQETGESGRVCESGCGCRYGTADPDQRDCACDGPCSTAGPAKWGCDPTLGGCGGDCPTCPAKR